MITTNDKFSIVNVGYGKSVKISNVLKTLRLFFKKVKKKEISFSSDIENSFANINMLKNNLKFKPKYNLKKGLEEILFYEKKKL